MIRTKRRKHGVTIRVHTMCVSGKWVYENTMGWFKRLMDIVNPDDVVVESNDGYLHSYGEQDVDKR